MKFDAAAFLGLLGRGGAAGLGRKTGRKTAAGFGNCMTPGASVVARHLLFLNGWTWGGGNDSKTVEGGLF